MENNEKEIHIEEYKREYQWLIKNTFIFNQLDISWEYAKIFLSGDEHYCTTKQIVKIMRRYNNDKLKEEQK